MIDADIPTRLGLNANPDGCGGSKPQLDLRSRHQHRSLDQPCTFAHAVTQGSPKFFTGTVKVEQLFAEDAPSRVSGGIVTFVPGSRTAWHTHPFGQILLITGGKGRVQMEGGPIQEVQAGDVVHIPPHVKHWHGADPDSSMTHIAIQDNLNGVAVDWLEPVTDQQYKGTK